MKRKVIRQGNNTLTITLPRSWTDKHNVKAGDELEISEHDRTLILGEQGRPADRSITIDVSGLDRTTILILLQGLYRFGYDTIEVSSDTQKIQHHRIDRQIALSSLIYDVTSRFVGAEVVSHTSKSFIIKRLASESIEDFPTVLRRIFLLLNEMMAGLILSIKTKDSEALTAVELQHTNMKKFINLALRLLNKFGLEESRKTCFYFNIISLLSKADDIIKNNARLMLKNGIWFKDPEAIELLKNVEGSLHMYYDLFYKFDLKKIERMSEHRDNLRNRLFSSSRNLTKEENIILGGLAQIVELVLDMTEMRMGLED